MGREAIQLQHSITYHQALTGLLLALFYLQYQGTYCLGPQDSPLRELLVTVRPEVPLRTMGTETLVFPSCHSPVTAQFKRVWGSPFITYA